MMELPDPIALFGAWGLSLTILLIFLRLGYLHFQALFKQQQDEIKTLQDQLQQCQERRVASLEKATETMTAIQEAFRKELKE